jgi:nucleoside-diphosphate-sugar epimerase
VRVDVFDPNSVTHAARGCDVIINALNPAYTDWARDLPRLTQAVIAAAQATGAQVVLPGNVYTFGTKMPPHLSADTPQRADTRKGQLRADMENAYRSAPIRTLILRAGDFIDTQASGNWFESHLAKDTLEKARFVYPGPWDQPHAWAYLPDLARAAAGLVDHPDLPRFTDVPFGGYTLTGSQLHSALEDVVGGPIERKAFPWFALRVMALFSPMMREVLEMRYLWTTPHSLDQTALAALLPDFRPKPLNEALAHSLGVPASVVTERSGGQTTSTQTSRWSLA